MTAASVRRRGAWTLGASLVLPVVVLVGLVEAGAPVGDWPARLGVVLAVLSTLGLHGLALGVARERGAHPRDLVRRVRVSHLRTADPIVRRHLRSLLRAIDPDPAQVPLGLVPVGPVATPCSTPWSGSLTEVPLGAWCTTLPGRGWPVAVVVGPPGAGKTLMLKDAARRLALGGRARSRALLPPRIPVLLCAADLQEGSLTDLVRRQLAATGRKVRPEWVAGQLRGGRLAVLIDDVDDTSGPDTLRHLLSQLGALSGSGNLVIVAAREAPSVLPAETLVLGVRALRAAQVETVAHSSGVRAPDLFLARVAGSRRRARMAGNPGLLALMLRAHEAGAVPGRPTELMCRLLDGAKGLDRELLERQAYDALVHGRAHAPPVGLPEAGWRDLLAASYIRGHGLEDELLARMHQPGWRQVAIHHAVMSGAGRVVDACLRDPVAPGALSLAADCLVATGGDTDRFRSDLARILAASEQEHPVREAVAEALLTLRAADETMLDAGRWITGDAVTWIEFCHVMGLPLPPGGPVRWSSPVRGIRHEDAAAFCRVLTESARGSVGFRLPTPREIRTAPGPRSWCSPLSLPTVVSSPVVPLRAFTQRTVVLPSPATVVDERWRRSVRDLLRTDAHASGTCTDNVVVPVPVAQHGCDVDEISRAAEVVDLVIREYRQCCGDLPLLLELADTSAQLVSVLKASDTNADALRAARLSCVRGLLALAAPPNGTAGLPDLLVTMRAGFTEVLSELCGVELARRGTWSEQPQLRYVRTSSSAPGADLDLVLGAVVPPTAWRRTKAVIDGVVAGLLLVLLSPALLVVVVAVELGTGDPAFFVQARVGERGRLFPLVKLRSMTQRPAVAAGPSAYGSMLFKTTSDPRVTPIGRWLRRTSLDEVPQLANVLAGEMSLVGPRPFLPNETGWLDEVGLRRLLVRPGLTGLWQVRGRGDLGWKESLELDNRYVDEFSAMLDVRILLETPVAVLRGRGAY